MGFLSSWSSLLERQRKVVSRGCHGCQCRDTGIRDGFLVVVTLEHLRLPGTHTGHTSHCRKAVESGEACSALRHRIPET